MLIHERKVYSQNGEDGILAHIFSQIGTTNRVAVEFGVESGTETNTRLLAEQGWQCIWFDGNPADNCPLTVKFHQAWLTADNIAQTFESAGVPQEFDLLSIDVDGNDYHLRAALKEYRPRVCVQEYNGSFPADTEYVMPRYDAYRWRLWDRTFGASLLSLTKQADELGYDLVYCEQQGVNAFFVRRDINVFPRLSAAEAYKPLWWAARV